MFSRKIGNEEKTYKKNTQRKTPIRIPAYRVVACHLVGEGEAGENLLGNGGHLADDKEKKGCRNTCGQGRNEIILNVGRIRIVKIRIFRI